MNGIYLTIDSSAHASVALVDAVNGTVLAERTSPAPNDQTETLNAYVAELLDDQQIQGSALAGIIVGVGPGPFTGLRVGLVAARTFAYVWSVPLNGVMSLEALVQRVLDADVQVPSEFVVAADARRRELYWARFDASGTLLEGPRVGAADTLPALPVYGAGAGLYPEQLEEAGAQPVASSADWLAEAALLGRRGLQFLADGVDLSDTAPRYLRESDAQVPAFMRKAQA
ncbi:tRNA (adenosine(37)-N6)-threonylcarbamoyltransferase complex dimerization subunit type 1 TsaB [Glutamicibacter endophyticus]|uniref:tRNA (adenosine(37)-N6)-threonylcarbamoyltransferase complex dimerization subunit type 1 TsaB n=1 Tax=Glutamicibacter endophyticus TaxID=1522174 RepID=UPI003AF188C6